MTISMISGFRKYKDYYLVYSGSHHDKDLTVLDSGLKVIAEFRLKIPNGVWDLVFHIDEDQPHILISITNTEIFPFAGKTYQGFNTIWFRLTESKGKFSLKEIQSWEKSDILTVHSRQIGNKRYWLCIKQLITVGKEGRIYGGIVCQLGIAITTDKLDVPEFTYPFENFKSVKHISFDFTVKDDCIYIAAACTVSGTTPSLIKLGLTDHTSEVVELRIPVKKFHHFQVVKLFDTGSKLFAYFSTSSEEYCKKYSFNIHKVTIDINDLTASSFGRLNNEEFIHYIRWSDKNVLAYSKVLNDPKTYIVELDENGNEYKSTVLEGPAPVYIGENKMIVADERSLQFVEMSSL